MSLSAATGAVAGAFYSPIHVATLNVRYDGSGVHTPIPTYGQITPSKPRDDPYAEYPWAVRRSRLADALLSSGSLEIVGFQEVLHNQLLDLAELLGVDFGHVGVGRDDGKEGGEHSPIFYSQTRFEMLKTKTIWLSETPDVPGSISWGAAYPRIATFVSLKDKQAGGVVHAICTHYDHISKKARAQSSLLLRKAARDWVVEVEGNLSNRSSPVLLFGDFNSPPNEEGYKNIISTEPINGSRFTFYDAYTNLRQRGPGNSGAQSGPYGPERTWTDFKPPGQENTTRIDFIMLGSDEDGKKNRWGFTQYAVIDNWIEQGDKDGWQGRWSDHRAVRATIQFN